MRPLRGAKQSKSRSKSNACRVFGGHLAQYHAHVEAISRAPTPKSPTGRSAVAAAAYRSGTKLADERASRVECEPVVHEYTRRRGVVHAEIILPPDAPAWANDRAALWNAAEAAEKRKDATVAREVECSLPHELDADQRTDLAREITRALVGRYGFAADFAIHRPVPEKGDDPRNHHVHIQCTTRVLAADGLGAKTRVLDDKKTGADEVRWIREMVARLCNEALARAGIDASVDHRSLVDQRAAALAEGDDERAAELDRPATKHRGPAVEAIVRDERDSYVEVRIQEELSAELAEIGRRQAAETAASEIDAMAAELEALRTEVSSVESQVEIALAEIAAAVVAPIRPEPPPAPSTDVVLEQIARLWAAYGRADRIHDDGRDGWDALRAMDRNGWRPDAPGLRAVLDAHPALRREWSAEITSREPEIAAAEQERRREQREIRRQAVRAIMSLVPRYPAPNQQQIPSESATDSEHPAAVPVPRVRPVPAEPPERKQLPAVAPAERRGRVELDVLIADAAARLAALEEREHRRRQAAEAYRLSQAALREAQSGLWARLRSFVGLGPAPAEKSAQAAVRAAEQAAKAAGAAITFGTVVLPPAGAERSQIQTALAALRQERTALVAEDAAAARRAADAVDQVCYLVNRADDAVPAELRADWPALRALDAAGGLARLREQLVRDPGLAIALAHDLGKREHEIEAFERQRGDEAGPAPGM